MFLRRAPNQVISPLSSLALKNYKFQYEGFITVGDFDVFKIKVTPKRQSDELVNGYEQLILNKMKLFTRLAKERNINTLELQHVT